MTFCADRFARLDVTAPAGRSVPLSASRADVHYVRSRRRRRRGGTMAAVAGRPGDVCCMLEIVQAERGGRALVLHRFRRAHVAGRTLTRLLSRLMRVTTVTLGMPRKSDLRSSLSEPVTAITPKRLRSRRHF